MPPFLLVLGKVDLEDIKLVLKTAELDETGAILTEEVAISFGALIESFISFLTLALAMFAVVKIMNKLKLQAEDKKDKSVPMPKDIELMTKMTELMEEQNKMLSAKKAS